MTHSQDPLALALQAQLRAAAEDLEACQRATRALRDGLDWQSGGVRALRGSLENLAESDQRQAIYNTEFALWGVEASL